MEHHFSRRLEDLTEYGLYSRWNRAFDAYYQRYLILSERKRNMPQGLATAAVLSGDARALSQNEPQPFSLDHLGMIFILWLFFVIVPVLQFLGEVAFRWLNRAQRC